MFAVARLGIDGRLAKTLTTSNPVESMISIARALNLVEVARLRVRAWAAGLTDVAIQGNFIKFQPGGPAGVPAAARGPDVLRAHRSSQH